MVEEKCLTLLVLMGQFIVVCGGGVWREGAACVSTLDVCGPCVNVATQSGVRSQPVTKLVEGIAGRWWTRNDAWMESHGRDNFA